MEVDVRVVPRYQEHEITHVSVEYLQEFLYFPFALSLSTEDTGGLYISPPCFVPHLLQLKGKEKRERERGRGRPASGPISKVF